MGRKILVGLSLGIATGLFLGEHAAVLRVVADGFVRLLQMTVLPYVTVSLVVGIGALDRATARRLFLRGGAVTLVLWALALCAVFLMPLCFPPLESASFFSTTLVEDRAPADFVSLYIPSNPFHSLANNVVPAVVLFCCLLGIALMGVEKKDVLLEPLRVVERALAGANRLVVRLTPLGLFAIAAHTAGTMDLDQVARLRVFQLAYSAVTVVLALWVFPSLIATVTPIPTRRVLAQMRDVFITAFVTADLFIVLPALIERAKLLLREHGEAVPQEGSAADVVVPAFYNFPHAAKMLSLSFVLFAAWYSETVVPVGEYPRLALAAVASFFGSINVAMPFLLDVAHVPNDTFQLFLATGVLNSRFGTLVAASHLVVLALVGTYAMEGKLKVTAAGLGRFAALTAVALAVTLGGLAVGLRALGGGTYEGAALAAQLGPRFPPAGAVTVLSALPDVEPPPPAGASLIEVVRARGKLRVGFVANQAPFSHFNARGELVGFDVEMAHALARELAAPLELAPVDREHLADALDEGRVDLVMAGIVVTTQRAARMTFSAPYLDETLAFLVPDHRRADFSDAAWVREQVGLRLGVPGLPYLEQLVAREFPKARVVPLPLNDPDGALSGRGEPVDAVVLTAERGSFLTLLHPAWSVAVPKPLELEVPLAYPVARHDVEAARFISTWIDLKKKDGTLQALYAHWILGRDAKAKTKRWSVLRDVLHWED